MNIKQVNIKQEIEKHADPKDREILLALFEKYHMSSQWEFVTNCTHKRYGQMSYETIRVWSPTAEGRCLYEHLIMKDNPTASLGQHCACGNQLQHTDRKECKTCASSSKI